MHLHTNTRHFQCSICYFPERSVSAERVGCCFGLFFLHHRRQRRRHRNCRFFYPFISINPTLLANRIIRWTKKKHTQRLKIALVSTVCSNPCIPCAQYIKYMKFVGRNPKPKRENNQEKKKSLVFYATLLFHFDSIQFNYVWISGDLSSSICYATDDVSDYAHRLSSFPSQISLSLCLLLVASHFLNWFRLYSTALLTALNATCPVSLAHIVFWWRVYCLVFNIAVSNIDVELHTYFTYALLAAVLCSARECIYIFLCFAFCLFANSFISFLLLLVRKHFLAHSAFSHLCMYNVYTSLFMCCAEWNEKTKIKIQE